MARLTTSVQIFLAPDTLRGLKLVARLNGESFSRVARDAVVDMLKRERVTVPSTGRSVRVRVAMPPSVMVALHVFSAQQGVPMSSLVAGALEERLSRWLVKHREELQAEAARREASPASA